MSDMVERVAEALEQGVCVTCGRPAIGQITPRDCMRNRPLCIWGLGTPKQQARAAIEAMREPTLEIREQVKQAIWKNTWGDTALDGHWRVMIDAALKAE